MSNLLKSKFFLGMMVVAGLVVANFASAAYMHTGLLKMGMTSSNVMSLQQTLNGGGFLVATTGAGSPGMESMYFGAKTKAAVMAFQSAKGLTADGVVGTQTGTALASMTGGSVSYPAGCTSTTGFSTTTGMSCASTGSTSLPAGCTSTAGFSSTTGASCSGGASTGSTGPLAGSVGSLDYALTSGYSNEEVGENENDVVVAGLELDAEDSDSDVTITAVKLNFDRGTAAAATDLEDVAEEVTVWLGTTKVATIDAAEFDDDNNEEKTVSLSGAVVRMDDKADLFVALSGVNNLDSGDIGDTWTVDFTQVRFVDAQGATTSEDPTTGVRTFSFESFATANNVELAVSLNSDEDAVNEAHVINVDATDDTDDVPLLAFELENEGDSDINLQELPVLVTVTGAGNVDDVIVSADLYHGTTKVDSQNIPATAGLTETVTFDDLDIDIDAGDTEEFWVKGNFISLADALDAGDTIKVEMTGTEVDAIDAEDESGENVVAADLTGTALGEASSVQDIGMNVVLVGTPTAVISHTGDIVGSGAGDDDQGTFEIVFDVTAFDGDIYIDGTSPTLTGAGALLDLNLTETGTHALTSATITSPSGATLTGTANADARFKVAEGETERFKVTAVLTVSVDGFASIKIADIVYALSDVTGTTSYTFNLDDFKTGDLYMNAN